MPNLGPPEILLILVVLVLLFGAKRLPDTARSLGKSMRIFKSETRAMRQDDDVVRPAPAPAPAPAPEPPRSLDPAPPRPAETRPVDETDRAEHTNRAEH
jgi:sec-independent protein translocase protein TatA